MTLEDALAALTSATRTFYRVTVAADGHDHPRHAGEAPRVRGLDRPDALSQQRRPEGSDRPPAHRRRRPADLGCDRAQRASRSRTRPSTWPPRPGSSPPSTRRGRKSSSTSSCSRWTARGCASTACRSRRRDRDGISGSVDVESRRVHAAGSDEPHAADVFVTGMPGIYYRLLKNDSNTRMLANPQLRTSEGIAGAGPLRRSKCRCRSRRSRRSRPAASTSSRSRRSPTRTSASTSTSRRGRTTTTRCR